MGNMNGSQFLSKSWIRLSVGLTALVGMAACALTDWLVASDVWPFLALTVVMLIGFTGIALVARRRGEWPTDGARSNAAGSSRVDGWDVQVWRSPVFWIWLVLAVVSVACLVFGGPRGHVVGILAGGMGAILIGVTGGRSPEHALFSRRWRLAFAGSGVLMIAPVVANLLAGSA